MSLPTYTQNYHTTTYPSISPSLPTLSTAGKVILVTGANSTIGTSIAHSFASSYPLALALLARSATSLTSVKNDLSAKHPSLPILTFAADITDQTAINSAFKEIKERYGGVDVMVQNAAYFPNAEKIAKADVEEYMRGFEVNVKGTLILNQGFLKYRREGGEGVIIHLSTGGVHLPAMPIAMSAYVASKTAVAKMMEYLSVELKGEGVRVTNVHPGMLDTVQGKKATDAGMVVPFDDFQLSSDFMVWLASPEADFLNGKLVWANWDVDELKARKEEIMSGPALTLGLNGWP